VNDAWKSLMNAAGARFDEHGWVAGFADPADEIRAAAAGDVLAELSALALIRVQGPDAASFLQGQLSNDIRLVSQSASQLSAYNTPKGRMLALLRIVRRGDAYLLRLPAELAADTLKRLKMYVLRAKVTLEAADDELIRFGLSGPRATDVLRQALGAAPEVVDAAVTHAEVTVLRLPGPHPRFELIAPLEPARALWSRLAAHCRAVGPGTWRWLDIQAGIPSVWPGTVEEFVPQMANLELVGGVSFKKGCYPGQEIVARMHYLGTLKQRMVRAHLDEATATCPAPGSKLYASEFGDQAAGTVVDAQPSPRGGCELLAVAQLTAIQGGGLRLATPNGPVLELVALPYPLTGSS
jgi:hypothetical protein